MTTKRPQQPKNPLAAKRRGRSERIFGNWLRKSRGQLTQRKAVEKMERLYGFKVDPHTWSRWESGERFPPEDKIDAIADTVERFRRRARALAGYPAPVKEGYAAHLTPASLTERMQREIMTYENPESRMRNLYVMLYDYAHQDDHGYRLQLEKEIEFMGSLARSYEALRVVSRKEQAAALWRIALLCEHARDLPLQPDSPFEMTLTLRADGETDVRAGTKIIIRNEGPDGSVAEQFTYLVGETEQIEGDKIWARLVPLPTRFKGHSSPHNDQ